MRTLLATLTITLALVAPVAAQGPAQDGYIPDGPRVVEQTRDDGGAPGDSTLPFTGTDLVLVGGLGLGLLAVGAGMRRLTRPSGPGAHTG